VTRVYIAIGSNLASPLEQVNAALAALAEIPDSQIVAVSPFYRTPPLGPQDQPDYLNAAVALDTDLAPETLLDHTQRIELQQGRERKAHRWGPRTLDLDIMLFGGPANRYAAPDRSALRYEKSRLYVTAAGAHRPGCLLPGWR